MFRECIATPIDPIPVEYIDTLNRPEGEPDYSLSCLGIAMLRPRIENYSGISGTYRNVNEESACVDEMLEFEYNGHPTFCYYMYRHPCTDRQRLIDKLAEQGFVVKENIGTFIKDKADIDCFAVYHKEKNFAGIFINSFELRFYHVLISFISLLFPAIFKDQPMKKPEDYNIVVSLSKTTKDLFVQRIQEAVKPYINEFRRLMLGTLLKGMHDVKIRNALNNVQQARNVVDSTKTALATAIKALKGYVVTYEGLKATEAFDQAEEDLIDYLSTNDRVHNLAINNNRLRFTVATYLNNFNEDAWATFRQQGYIFDGEYKQNILLDVFREEENRKILLNSIFSESPEFAVKVAGNYCLDLQSCEATANRDFDYIAADPIFKTYLPNPHLKIFACLGGYEDRIMDAMEKRNYIGAVELCCASAGSVDLDESDQTFRPFLGWIMTSREKILHRKDGEDMTPEEALVWLIDQKEQKKEEK